MSIFIYIAFIWYLSILFNIVNFFKYLYLVLKHIFILRYNILQTMLVTDIIVYRGTIIFN